MQSHRYLFRRSKLRFSPAVWPVGVHGWFFLLACNLVFFLSMITIQWVPFGIWTVLAAGLALLSIITLFAGLARHTDWTLPPPGA